MVHPRLITLLCVWLTVAAQPLAAGAWPRETGTGFLALGGGLIEDTGTGTQVLETTLYADWGLRNRYTLGLAGVLKQQISSEAHVFLRFPPREFTGGALVAAEIGLGAKTVDANAFDPYARLGLSWSKGLPQGWLSLDSTLVLAEIRTDQRIAFDATWGRNLTDRVTLMGQAFSEATHAGQALTLAPSVILRPARGPSRYVFGIERRWGSGPQIALRAGVWTDF